MCVVTDSGIIQPGSIRCLLLAGSLPRIPQPAMSLPQTGQIDDRDQTLTARAEHQKIIHRPSPQDARK
jgi:hypothetical protein